MSDADLVELNTYSETKSISVGDGMDKAEPTIKTACSSVFMSLVSPEECPSREEEIALLKDPEALWTVLMVNSPPSNTLEEDVAEYLTPIAQYIRGIVACVSVQQAHAQSIFASLKFQLEQHDDNVLFDDDQFTKSRLYHRIIKSCHLLNNSLTASVRFIQRFRDTQLHKLSREAHSYESDGIAHWTQQLNSEVAALEDTAQQFTSLRETVQENRNALHGATAVLQARLALQQGDRIKTLTYLATAYLPLATVASIYSMSVLPSSATFLSFFIVFAGFLAVTLLCGVSLTSLHERTMMDGRTISTKTIYHALLKSLVPIRGYFKHCFEVLAPATSEAKEEEVGCIQWLPGIVAGPVRLLFSPATILGDYILPEIFFLYPPLHQFRHRNHFLADFQWDPVLCVLHILRATMIPLWVLVAVVLIVEIIVIWIFKGIFYILSIVLSCLRCSCYR